MLQSLNTSLYNAMPKEIQLLKTQHVQDTDRNLGFVPQGCFSWYAKRLYMRPTLSSSLPWCWLWEAKLTHLSVLCQASGNIDDSRVCQTQLSHGERREPQRPVQCHPPSPLPPRARRSWSMKEPGKISTSLRPAYRSCGACSRTVELRFGEQTLRLDLQCLSSGGYQVRGEEVAEKISVILFILVLRDSTLPFATRRTYLRNEIAFPKSLPALSLYREKNIMKCVAPMP